MQFNAASNHIGPPPAGQTRATDAGRLVASLSLGSLVKVAEAICQIASRARQLGWLTTQSCRSLRHVALEKLIGKLEGLASRGLGIVVVCLVSCLAVSGRI